jgi:hypothetical protein
VLTAQVPAPGVLVRPAFQTEAPVATPVAAPVPAALPAQPIRPDWCDTVSGATERAHYMPQCHYFPAVLNVPPRVADHHSHQRLATAG